MTEEITSRSVPSFVAWLEPRRPLGMAWENKALTISDKTATWCLRWPLGHVELLDEVAEAVARSGRRVWTPAATDLVLRLVRRHGVESAASWDWLRDSGLAHTVANPGYEPAAQSARNGKELTALAKSRQLAARMESLASQSSRELIEAINLRTGLDAAWRPRQLTGVTLDTGSLEHELDAATATRRTSAQLLGIDLLDDSTDMAVARIHEWLASVGIFVLDRDGQPTLDSATYDQAIVPSTTIAQARFAEFRRARKVGRRLWKLLELKRNAVQGVVYPKINVQGAITGRGSITQPSLGNVNRDLRRLLVARPGYVLVGADLHAAEPSVAAILSGDPTLAQDLATGDVYMSLARQVFGPGADAAARQQAKTCFLGILYGRGATSVADELGLTRTQAADVISGIKVRYAALTEWSEDVISRAKRGEAQFYPDGRPLPPLAKESAYKGVNYGIQGWASTVFYRMVDAVASDLGSEHLFLPVHDELVVEVPQLMGQHAVEVLRRRMYSSVGGVTISADPQVLGRAWSK